MRDHFAGRVLAPREANLCSAAASRRHVPPVAGAPALGPGLPRLLMLWRRCRGGMSLLSPMESASTRQAGNRNRQRDRQTGGRQPIRSVFSPPHFPRLCSLHFAVLQCIPVTTGANLLRIRCDILLQIQIIEQLEIRIHLVILFQSLQDRSPPCPLPATGGPGSDNPAARNEQSHANSHNHRQRRRQNRTPEPMHPARLRFCHLLAQASLQPHVEVRRRLRNLPLIEQRHGRAHRFQLFRTSSATFQMLAFIHRGLAESSGHLGHPFSNFIAFHNRFPFTLFATVASHSKSSASLNKFF